jgi:hypothetical protein
MTGKVSEYGLTRHDGKYASHCFLQTSTSCTSQQLGPPTTTTPVPRPFFTPFFLGGSSSFSHFFLFFSVFLSVFLTLTRPRREQERLKTYLPLTLFFSFSLPFLLLSYSFSYSPKTSTHSRLSSSRLIPLPPITSSPSPLRILFSLSGNPETRSHRVSIIRQYVFPRGPRASALWVCFGK